MLQAKLKVVGGRHHGKIIPLATRKFLIGREQDCHLRPNSELVSRHHCAIWVDDFSVRVRYDARHLRTIEDSQILGSLRLRDGGKAGRVLRL